MTNAIAAGYIVHDVDRMVYGIGATMEAAITDSIDTLKNIEDAQGGDLTVIPATQTLINMVVNYGGHYPWQMRDGVACTKDEAEGE